jgi:hypothetical protein
MTWSVWPMRCRSTLRFDAKAVVDLYFPATTSQFCLKPYTRASLSGV